MTSTPAASGFLISVLPVTDSDIPSNDYWWQYFDVELLAGEFWYGYSEDATESKLSPFAGDEEAAAAL